MGSDREADLQADSLWLRELSEALHDAEYAKLLAILASPAESRSSIPPGMSHEEYARAIRAATSFEGDSLLSRVFQAALQSLNSSDHTAALPESVVVLFTAIPTVNGFCLRTPNSGTPAIVLNQGLPEYIAIAVHLFMGLTGWSDQEYCTHWTNDDRLDSLFRLSLGITDKRPALLLDVPAADCLGSPEHKSNSHLHDAFCIVAEFFIIFHEIGHAALGHLDPDDVSLAFGPELGHAVPVFNRSQTDELSADSFALTHLTKSLVEDGGLAKRDIAYGIGCLMVLMRTVEAVSPGWSSETHPSAVHRWSSIRKQIGDPNAPAAVDSVHYFFEWIRNYEAAASESSEGSSS